MGGGERERERSWLNKEDTETKNSWLKAKHVKPYILTNFRQDQNTQKVKKKIFKEKEKRTLF